MEEQVRIIKQMIAASVSDGEIAQQFEVTPGAIKSIRFNKNWKHITL